MERLVHDWHIVPLWPFLPHWPALVAWSEYLVLALALQTIVRVFISGLGAIELTYTPGKSPRLPYCKNFCYTLRGLHPNDPDGKKSDLWIASILGLLELWTYPVLMATGAWTVIGAWLGFKTLAQWRTWSENRFSYNRYLVGNAVVVLLSLLFLTPFIVTTAPACAP